MVDVKKKVYAVIVEQLGIRAEEIKAESSLIDDLGADSLDMVGVCMACEQEFSIEIPDEDAEKALTVQNLIDLIDKILKK